MYSVTETAISKVPNPNVILYLPRGPIFQNRKSLSQRRDPLHIQHYLATVTSSTIVTVHYRLGTEYQQLPETEKNVLGSEEESAVTMHHTFPTPVHDTLAVFDWVQDTFQPRKLNVLGTHIGGSIALALALTESRAIHAVAVVEPICDWTGLDGHCVIHTEDKINTTDDVNEIEDSLANLSIKETERERDDYDVLEEPDTPQPLRKNSLASTSGRAPPDLVPLLEAREMFFVKPAAYFDPFASPLLFLRTPGKGIPVKPPRYHSGPEYPVPVLQRGSSGSPLLDFWEDEDDLPPGVVEVNGEYIQTGATTVPGDILKAFVPRYRKALSRWPPLGLENEMFIGAHRQVVRFQMTLPWVKFYVNGLPTQLRSPAKTGASRRSKRGRTVLAQQADEMVNIMRRACFWGRDKEIVERGVVLAGSTEDGTYSVLEEEAAGWLSEIYNEKR